MTSYLNLRQGLASKAKLIPISDNIYDYIKHDNKHDWYVSIYQYNEDHKKILNEKGTLSGIKDVLTDMLYFDFDSEKDIKKAQKDAVELCKRLDEAKIKDYTICFSGMKGFSVEVYITELLTPQEFKLTTAKLAEGLETFDTTVSDPQRIIRVPNTKHQKSGLFKIPLTFDELSTLGIDQIKANALKPLFDAYTTAYVDLPDGIKQSVPVKENVIVESHLGFDLKNKPAQFDSARWLLNNGFFENGERSIAMLCLASFYKSLGYPIEQCYRILKGTAELQAKRTGGERFPDEELYNNIVSQVYSSNWRGGTFSLQDKESWLYSYAKKHNIDVSEGVKVGKFVDIESDFISFVTDIESNTIKTGIKDLDDEMLITTGSQLGIVGPASSGKCLGKDTPVLMFDGSIKNVQDIIVGDLLMGDDKTPRTVLSTCSGFGPLYRIDQEKGDSYITNDVHILSLKCKINMKKKGKVMENSIFKNGNIIDIPVNEYIHKSESFKRYFHGYKADVDFSEKIVPLEPYTLGYWLGNGTTGLIEFSYNKNDKEIETWLNSVKDEYNYHLNIRSESTNGITVGITDIKGKPNILLNKLRETGVSENKRIPELYLKNSRNIRLALLAGLIDSDGSYCRKTKWYEITFKNKDLSDDVLFLIRSLGIHAKQSPKIAKYKSFTKGKLYTGESLVYRITFGGQNCIDIPCKLPRKKYNEIAIRDSLSGRIYPTAIGEGEYFGFEIDGNKRFLLGDFTVTHNTSILLDILNNTSKSDVQSVFASLDMYRTRIFEKICYRVTDGKYDRSNLYEMYKTGKHLEIKNKINEEFGNVWFYDRSSPTVQNIRDYVLNVEQTSGKKVKMVAVDYFERISSDMSDDTAASKRVSAELQDMMNDLNCCIIILYQPNKFSLSSGPDVPLKSYTAIKGSSFVFQSLRNIISVSRPGHGSQWQEWDKYMNINILKNDLGQLGSYDLHWNGKTGRTRELEDHERKELKEFLKMKETMKNMETQDNEWG